jgi:predicted  nucleic acid-binding Zn-ribbon protein
MMWGGSVTNRLEDLKREFEKGKQRLEALDRERQELRDTMLRISGAIQVIEELLSQQSPANPQSELASVNA